MTNLNLPPNTLVITTTGEEAFLYRYQSEGLRKSDHWTPRNLADEGPSGKSPAEQSAKESMEATFSKQVAERLYVLAHKGAFSDLVLIADPDSLGEIRPLLHKEVQDRIIVEIDKTLINASTDEIEKSITSELN